MAIFILNLTYVTTDIAEVDALLADHLAWLEAGRGKGHFLAWGRKVPREGGAIIAKGESREAVEALAATDPFIAGGVAKMDVIEWVPTFLGEGLEALAQ